MTIKSGGTTLPATGSTTPGPQGPAGPAGHNGSSVTTGQGAPTAQGNPNDVYIDAITGDLYRNQ